MPDEWLDLDCKCGQPLYHEVHDDNNLMGHQYDPDLTPKPKDEHAITDDERERLMRIPFAEFDLGFLQ